MPLALRRRSRSPYASTGPGETSRATGVFRSKINTSSPFFTYWMWALSLAFNSLIFAVLISQSYHNMTNLVMLRHSLLRSEDQHLFAVLHVLDVGAELGLQFADLRGSHKSKLPQHDQLGHVAAFPLKI